MKTLFFSPKFYPEPNFYINDIVFDLEIPDKVVLTGKKISYKNISFFLKKNKVNIYYIPYFERSRNTIFSLLFEYFSFFLLSFLIIPIVLFLERPKKIFYYGISPPFYIFPFILLKVFFRYKIIFWVQDIWPESIFLRMPFSNAFYRFIKFLMSIIYKFSDRLILISKKFKGSSRFKKYEIKIDYIPQGCKQETKSSLDEYSLKIFNLIKNETRKVIIYAGNVSNSMFLEEMAEAVNKNKNDFVFYIIGDGPLKKKLIKKNYKKVFFFEFVERNSILKIIKQADFAFLGRKLDKDKKTKIISKIFPAKLSIYLYCQVPIISLADEDLYRYINRNNLGYVNKFSGVKELSDWLSSLLLETEEKINSIKFSQKDLFSRNFDHNNILKKIKAIIEK